MANSARNIYQDGSYLRNNPSWNAEDAPFKANAIAQILSAHTISFNSFCEIGCGSGEVLVQLAQRFPGSAHFTGYDISGDAIRIAKNRENEKLQFYERDIVQDGLDHVDIIAVLDVLEHVENYFEFLRAISGRSAYVIFHIPLDLSVWSLFREQMLIESKQRVGHIHNFTEDFILDILKDHGFIVIDKIYTPPSFTNMSLKQQLVNGIRKLLFRLSKRFTTKTLGGYSILVLTKNN